MTLEPSPDSGSLRPTNGTGWLDAWEAWRRSRSDTVTAPHGIAALTSTTWLGTEPVEIPGLDGMWCDANGRARRNDGEIELLPGEQQVLGPLVLKAIGRPGVVALRVFDPEAASRTSLAAIGAFDPDPAWVVEGMLDPAGAGVTVEIEHIDGFTSIDPLAGTLRATVHGHDLALTALATPEGRLHLVLADATNGDTTQQFRFLYVAAPGPDGRVTIDFNRTHLPPCAFSDHYLCPLPPPENRLPFALTAGETRAVRR